jgi:hypothetical protein
MISVFQLVSCRLTVLTRLAPADVDTLAIVHLNFDCLISAVTANVEADVVSAFF